MSMKASLRILVLPALAAAVCISAAGCTGADDTKITKAAPPAAPTEAEKAPAKGMPKDYGKNSAYEKAMEKAANR